MNSVPPQKRNTTMVFQEYALWPHMTVAENVAYGLTIRKMGSRQKRECVKNALEIVRMQHFANRKPHQLSGGQQQRVALARALVINPDVLLLDEPLSNLDAKLRSEMRDEIRRIHEETRITTVYVTHDQKESLSLADRMAVMNGGKIEQIGTPRSIYRQPATRFVADFVGETNWIPASLISHRDEASFFQTSAGTIKTKPHPKLRRGHEVWLGIRPEGIKVGAGSENQFEAELIKATHLGEMDQYDFEVSGSLNLRVFEQFSFQDTAPNARSLIHLPIPNIFIFEKS